MKRVNVNSTYGRITFKDFVIELKQKFLSAIADKNTPKLDTILVDINTNLMTSKIENGLSTKATIKQR